MIFNLILRTEYSFLSSLCSLEKTIQTAKDYGYNALAISDIHNLHGGYKFYKLCKKYNIKPIIGIEIIVEYNGYKENLLVYAMDNFGYNNVLKIASKQKINNKVDLSFLQNTSIGVLAVLPPHNNQLINRNSQLINFLKNIYSDFYIGINKELVDSFEYVDIHNWLVSLGVKEVAVNETCYIRKEEHSTLMVLNAIKNNKILRDIEDDKKDYHFYSVNEFNIIFGKYSYLLDSLKEINKKCFVEIKNNGFILPKYDENIDAVSYLKALCYKGLQKRLNNVSNVYLQRLEKELKIIEQMGFADYFLVVWDYVKYAKKNDILVGPGRGSAPASLVSYSLGITEIDPIKYNLLFERFLNPERISMPDIDIDFPDNKRDEVIRYVGSRYGKMSVAHIATFGTFASKSAIRDVAKALELSDVRLEEILKHLKDSKKSLVEIYREDESLQALANNYEDIKKVIETAIQISGLPRNVSTHAAGIIITRNELTNYTPLDLGLNDIYQTQYEASDLEELGLLKMDFLGLRNLTIIKNCIDDIKKDYPDFKLPSAFDDKATLALITNGDTTGVFQLESEGMKQTLRQLKVDSFNDICSALALYRPGPMDMIPTFINRKLGIEKVSYVHKDLENILKPTNGIIVYQEQIIMIACQFAGYSLGEADILRRAVSKKKKDVLEKEKNKFVTSSMKKGYSIEVAEEIYEYIIKFANYGFNKAHSVAYSVIAYYTAYLKCHFSKYYYSVLLNSVIGTTNLVNNYIFELNKRKIKVASPDINLSTDEYQVISGKIILPLTQIEGIGPSYYEIISNVRQDGFKSFEDFIEKCGEELPASLIENLIYAGALDSFGITKKSMIDNYGLLINRKKYSFVKNTLKIEFTNEEFSYGYLLSKENEMLGVNIKYNFLYQYEGYYRRRTAIHIEDIKEGKVTVLGAVTKIREITTKKDTKMFFINIKDETGTISVTVFPSFYETFKQIRVGMVLIITGKAEKRNNEMQIVLDDFRQI